MLFRSEPQARAAGVPEAIIEAIRTNATPRFEKTDEAIVYEVSLTLNHTRKIPDKLYNEALKILGEARLIDLIGVLGYYTLISMTINAFEVEQPADAPKPMEQTGGSNGEWGASWGELFHRPLGKSIASEIPAQSSCSSR